MKTNSDSFLIRRSPKSVVKTTTPDFGRHQEMSDSVCVARKARAAYRILALLIGLAILLPLHSSSAQKGTNSADLCPPLPPPSGVTVEVSSVAGLQNAVNNAAAGSTILVDDGTYALNGVYLRIAAPGVTLRSKSGEREAVVLDGNYQTTEIVQVVASNVTIADITLKRAYYHLIHVMASDGADTTNTQIYNVHGLDPGQQAIKINQNSAYTHYADSGRVACSRLELTDAGRPHIWAINASCYTGGVDGHQAKGWTIRDNTIQGFWCDSGLSEHAIHFWTGSRDTLVERNTLRDNARGIGFGLGQSGSNWRTYNDNPCPGVSNAGHYGGVIRNNFIFASRSELLNSGSGFDCGVCLEQACRVDVLHNTVASTQAPFSSIEWRFSGTSVDVYNNLVTHNLRARDNATANQGGNLENAPLSLFVNAAGGDLHLASSASQAIDKGIALAGGLCDDDIDGEVRPIGPARDTGADEYGVPAPPAVKDLRLANVTITSGSLTGTLHWSAPAGAVSFDLKYAYNRITEASWPSATSVVSDLPVGTGTYTATVPYTSGTVTFAIKSRSSAGDGWSALSNNAFWPHWDILLPVVR